MYNYAHLNSILARKDTPIPLDTDTYAYFNYENLWGAIHPTTPLVREYNAGGSVPLSMVKEADFNKANSLIVPGKHGQGLNISEQTTNLSSTITFSSYAPYHNISSDGNNITMVWNTDNAYITIGSSTYLPEGKTLTITGIMKRNGIPHYFNGTRVNTYNQDCTVNEFNSETGEFRIVQFYNTSSTWFFHAYVTMAIGDILTIEDFQIEEKPYNTSYVENSRPSLYLKYMIPSNIKTFSFWFKSDSTKAITYPATPRVLLSQTTNDGTAFPPYWYCCITSDASPLFSAKNLVGLVVNNGSTYSCEVPINVQDMAWHHVTIELNTTSYGVITNTVCRLWVDGQYAETKQGLTDEGYPSSTYFPGFLRLGHMDETESTAFSNCLYDDLALRTAHYPPAEIRSWYISNREHTNPYDYSITL